MFDFISQGGYVMWLQVIGFLIMVIFSGVKAVQLFGKNGAGTKKLKAGINNILIGGVILGVLGIFGTLLGIYSAFQMISMAAEISPPIIFIGIAIALSTSLMGLFLFLLFLIVWAVLKNRYEKLTV